MWGGRAGAAEGAALGGEAIWSSPEHNWGSKEKAPLLGQDGAWVLGFTPQGCGVQSTCLPLPPSLLTRSKDRTERVKWGSTLSPAGGV